MEIISTIGGGAWAAAAAANRAKPTISAAGTRIADMLPDHRTQPLPGPRRPNDRGFWHHAFANLSHEISPADDTARDLDRAAVESCERTGRRSPLRGSGVVDRRKHDDRVHRCYAERARGSHAR